MDLAYELKDDLSELSSDESDISDANEINLLPSPEEIKDMMDRNFA